MSLDSEKIQREKLREESAKALKRLKRRIMKESKMEGEIGKITLAESLAMLIIQQRVLYSMIMEGTASSELQKSYPTYSSRIKNHCMMLGLATMPKEEDDDDEEFLGGL